MDMLMPDTIAEAQLTDWRKLAQGIHARFLTSSFHEGATFLAKIGEAANAAGHAPIATISNRHIDLKLVSDDAIYRDDDGTEYVVQWVTQKDIDLARSISAIAVELGLTPDAASVSHIELGLNTPDSSSIAPVWAALLTGQADSQGYGSPSDEIRDASARVPNLWFGDADDSSRQRFHLEVYVAAEARDERIAAVLAAGGSVIDDSNAPGLTVVADQDGNTGVLCVAS